MNSEELASLVDKEIANSVGYFDSKLAEQRREAMDYYLGEPFGNEVEGQSQFISRDVADTIEGIMPSLMRIFTSTDQVVRFEPHGIEDVHTAQQVTDYVNYTFNRQNNGFVVLYTFFKDALLQKNGFCKVYWDEYTKKRVEKYENISPEGLQTLISQLMAEGYQVEPEEIEQGENGLLEATLAITDTSGRVCIDPIPPEEIRVNKNATWDLQKCRFVAHEKLLTASELREMGIDPEGLEPYHSLDWNQEKLARFQKDQEDFFHDDGGHEPNEEYLIRECYMLVDWDGDGISERRCVLESGGKILTKEDGEECNYEIDRVPIVTTTPILMPHKLYGLSIADLVSDLQLLKSTLIRQILNNMYLTNNSRVMVLDGMANIDDLLTVRPGGVVRVKTFDAVKPMPVPFFGAPAFQMLGYIDQIREVRSGQRHFQGINPDAINKDISGLALDKFAAASMEKIELIARIFAETGVKEMMWAIFELLLKHENKQRVIRLQNQWVQIDPRAWSNKYDMTVTVGLGTGSKAQLLQGAQMIGNIQLEIAKNGGLGRIVTEENIYNYAREVADAILPKKADLFFTKPPQTPPEPKPDPELEFKREKAYMQDKTKRDTSAVEFLKFIAEQSKPDNSMDMAMMNNQNQRATQLSDQSFQREIKGMEMQRDNYQVERETEMQAAKTLVTEMGSSIQQMHEAIGQLAQSNQQLMISVGQMTKIMAAPKRLIMDENGEPIGAEPVLEEEESNAQ